MRKQYSTPDIVFQSLSTTGLSAACTFTATHAANICPVTIPQWNGETIFSDYSICNWTPEDNVCYDVPTMSSNVFES